MESSHGSFMAAQEKMLRLIPPPPPQYMINWCMVLVCQEVWLDADLQLVEVEELYSKSKYLIARSAAGIYMYMYSVSGDGVMCRVAIGSVSSAMV